MAMPSREHNRSPELPPPMEPDLYHLPSAAASLDAVTQAQRDQDVRAAFQFGRARSGTTGRGLGEDGADQLPALGASASPPRDVGGLGSPRDRRMPSAEAQMEQDVQFFGAGTLSASPGHAERAVNCYGHPAGSPNGHTPTAQHQVAAARLYGRQRNLSDTSLDSSHGALIDHRHQSHFLPSGSPISPHRTSGSHRHDAGGRSGLRDELPLPSRPLQRLGTDSDDEDFDLADEVAGPRSPRLDDDALPSIPCPRPDSPRTVRRAAPMSASRTTERPGDLSGSRSGSSAVASEEEEMNGVLDHRARGDAESSKSRRYEADDAPYLGRQQSRGSQTSAGSAGRRLGGDVRSMLTTSRRPSQAQEDVCFPMHQEHGRNDLIGPLHLPPLGVGARGLPGVLPNFPFPFDFAALEEFADREKEAWEAVDPGSKHGIPIDMNGASPGDAEGMRRRRLGFGGSPRPQDSPEGGERKGRLAMLKQRRLSESVGPVAGRQRKLALFEGGSGPGDEPAHGGAVALGRGGMVHAPGSDAKAPLLGKLHRGYSATGGRNAPGTANSGVDRPYRFSFYSNALSSTIHARSLAEIPGDGQSFEDLFTGRQPSESESMAETDLPMHAVGGSAGAAVHRTPLLSPQSRLDPSWSSSRKPTPQNSALSNGYGLGAAQGRATPGAGGSGVGAAGPGLRLSEGMSAKGNVGGTTNVAMRSDQEAETNTWWLDVLCPTDQEMKVLSKVFGIHPLTTEDIQMEETREKIELFRNYYLVCFRSFDQDPFSPTYLEPLNMYIIVFREGTLSFHFRGTPHPQNVRRRIKQLKDYINVTSDWISYALIDDITDAFGPLIQSIEYEVDSIDELVLILKDAEQSDMLRRIGTCRKKVMGLLRLMGNKADVVKGLAKRCNENWSVAPKSDIGLYLSDIQDHLVTMTQNLNHYEKILSRSHSNYLAQISIEMTDANNQINDVLSKLTALGSILVPMNLVTGLWGMNVHVPGQDIETGYTWFISIVCGLVAFGAIGAWLTLKYFKFSDKK